jgi:ABC-type branched-subunit amino acid transport system substrate-binding protein
MKTPEEYVLATTDGQRPTWFPAAEAAVAQALADADRYRENLMRALRNTQPSTPTTGTQTNAE